MSWIELSLDATAEAVDWVRTLLAEHHYTNDLRVVNYNGAGQAPTEASEPWAFTIRFYLPDRMQAKAQVAKISQLLSPLHRTGQTTALEVAIVDEIAPDAEAALIHRVGRFVILSPNAPFTATASDVPLRLKTSLSFGSGLHPATVLSLRLIERHVTSSMQVLDLGCGSGILSVAIAGLNAQVLALDNDPTAVEATQDAVDRNGVQDRVTVMKGSLGRGGQLGHWMGGTLDTVTTLEPTARFDLIVANIFARVHIDLAEDYGRSLRQTEAHCGFLITSGFTADYETEVTTALDKAGFKAIDHERSGEWLAISFAKL